MTRAGSAAAGAALLCLLAGCVSGEYTHETFDEPVAREALAALQPGTTTLATCLHVLGAPNRVHEYHVEPDGSSGMALLWFWHDASGWGIEVSGRDDVPGSLSVDHDHDEVPGCVLWFRSDLVLERWRAGPVGDLARARRRPSSGAADG